MNEMGRKNETEILTEAIGMDAFEDLPGVSGQALQHAQSAQQSLAQALPQGELKSYPGQEPLVGADEQRRFMTEFSIATNPMWVLDRADDGSLSPEHMTILGKYYPAMQQDILAQLRQLSDNEEMSYQQRLVLSEILGDAVTADTEPGVRAILGSVGVGGQPEQPAPAPTSKTRPHSSRKLQGHRLSSSSGSMTDAQRTAFDLGDE